MTARPFLVTPLRRPRTRAELARLVAQIGATRIERPAVVSVEIRHDDHCPLLWNGRLCTCDVEIEFAEVTS
jgi:hypothetical protein